MEPGISDSQFRKSDDNSQEFLDATIDKAKSAGSSPTMADKSVALPATVGRYLIERKLGQGAMGIVYRARDSKLGRTVALKIPRLSGDNSESLVKRLKREALIVAKLELPNISRLYDYGCVDGTHFIAMEYVEGEDLKRTLHNAGGKLTPVRAVKLMISLLCTIDSAHRQGIVHRDLKPANIMIRGRDGEPVILDFGLARECGLEIEGAFETLEGSIVGSAAYMSPEQASGNIAAVDRRSDIYALGVILFEMLTGAVPFQGSAIELMATKINREPLSPIDLNPSLSPGLAEICHKMIARRRDDRYSTCLDVVDALKAVENYEPDPDAVETRLLAPPAASIQTRRRRHKFSAIWPILCGGVLLMIAAAIAWSPTPHRILRIEIEDPEINESISPLENLQRSQISESKLTLAGRGNPQDAPEGLVAVLGEPLPIHTAPATCLAFSADDRWLATGSDDETIIIRDTSSLRPACVLRGHSSSAMGMAFSADGKSIVAGYRDGSVRLWRIPGDGEGERRDLGIGNLTAITTDHDRRRLAVSSESGHTMLFDWGEWASPAVMTPQGAATTIMAFSPTGHRLACGKAGKDAGTIEVFNTADGSLARRWQAHRRIIRDMIFHPDGNRLVTAGDESDVIAWNLETGEPIEKWTADLENMRKVAIRPDGKALAVLKPFDSEVLLHDLHASKTESLILFGPETRAIAYNEKGDSLAIAFSNGALYFGDGTTGKQHYFAGGHQHFVIDAAFSPDGTQVISIGDDFTIRRWEILHGTACRVIGQPQRTSTAQVSWSPDGETLTGATDVFDSRSNAVRFKLPQFGLHSPTVFSPDGTRLAGCYIEHGLRIHDAARGVELWNVPTTDFLAALTFSEDGAALIAVRPEKQSVTFWDAVSGNQIQNVEIPFNPRNEFRSAAAIDRDMLAVGHDDGAIDLWDLPSRAHLRTLSAHTARVSSLTFFNHGTRLVSAGFDGMVCVWDPKQPRLQETFTIGPRNHPVGISVDSSGQYILAYGAMPCLFVIRVAR